MKKTLTTLLTLLTAFTVIACASDKTTVTYHTSTQHEKASVGKTATYNYDCTGFTVIDCSTIANIHYTQGKDYSVRLETNIPWKPKFNVTGKTLHITAGNTNGTDGTVNINGKAIMDVYITSPDLRAVNLSYTSNFYSGTIKGERLKIATSGATSVNVDAVDCTTFIVDTDGMTTLTVGDLTSTQSIINMAGATNMTIDNAQCGSLKVNSSGACNLHLNKAVTNTLTLDEDGMTTVNMDASAKTATVNVAGASNNTLRLKADRTTLDVSGACSANLTLSGGTLNVSAAGMSSVNADLAVNSVTADCTMTSSITLTGTAKDIHLDEDNDSIHTKGLKRK